MKKTSADFLGFLWAANVSSELPEVISRGSCTLKTKKVKYTVVLVVLVLWYLLHSYLYIRVLQSWDSLERYYILLFLPFIFLSLLFFSYISPFLFSLSLPQLFASSLQLIFIIHIEP